MKTFKEYLTENIDVVDGKLDFSSETGISDSFGKGSKFAPYKKRVEDSDIIVYSLYSTKIENSTEILRMIKNSDDTDELKKFLNRSAVYAARVIRPLEIDIIVTPKSSSDLTKSFVEELQRRTNYDIFIDSFHKTPDISNIIVDKIHPKITDKIADSMQKVLDSAKRKGRLSLTKFPVMYRKFLKNLFVSVDESLLTKFDGKNVLIIDDILTSGSTAKSISDILLLHGAKTVYGLTIFKASH
jgi:hypothetical protein